MLARISWPQAAVICVLALVVGVLQYVGALPPEWAASVGSSAVLLAGVLRPFAGDAS